MRQITRLFAGCIAMLVFDAALAGPALGTTIIDHTPPLTTTGGPSTIPGFGQSWGQTFTVGADIFLESFTLFTDYLTGTTAVEFRAYLMEWSTTANILGMATGPVLFESGDIIESSAGVGTLTERAFFPGVTLESGTSYVFFLNASASVGEFGFDDGATGLGYQLFNVYADGRAVSLEHGSDFDAVTTSSWSSPAGGGGLGDLSFRAVLIPEPSTFVLVLVGMLMLSCRGWRWRRR